ncbi:MAG: endonuclease/exonuclease/phosphatase family protein [Chloroflexota bacterium]|nr:endonuclease/exonuclease/phosphatase family protein [Chloroflexota bacterium]MDQ5865619.1 endonuclease/exonuclease/phosphatase family protein [Chloroflexota bacterium]
MLRKLRTVLLVVLTAYPVALLLLMVTHAMLPQREGVLALTQIFAPYLFLPLLALLPLAFLRGAVPLRIALLLCIVVFGLRFMPRLASPAVEPAPGAMQITALSWNVEVGGDPASIREMLLAKQPDIAAFQEIDWLPLQRDPELLRLYPHFFVQPPYDATSGMVLLSKFPMREARVPDFNPSLWERPRMVEAKLDVGGRVLNVQVVHPAPAGRRCRLPLCYDSALRDARLSAIRTYIEPAVLRGEAVLLVGDFNTTEREPGYWDVSRGLQDGFKAVGVGAGNTWGPPWLRNRGLALLRIDYIFSGPNLRPLQFEVDCKSKSSDHCALMGKFELQ